MTTWNPFAAPAPAPRPAREAVFVVLAGENTSSIARRLGVPVPQLLAANPRQPRVLVAGRPVFDGLLAGQRLNAPGVGLDVPGTCPSGQYFNWSTYACEQGDWYSTNTGGGGGGGGGTATGCAAVTGRGDCWDDPAVASGCSCPEGPFVVPDSGGGPNCGRECTSTEMLDQYGCCVPQTGGGGGGAYPTAAECAAIDPSTPYSCQGVCTDQPCGGSSSDCGPGAYRANDNNCYCEPDYVLNPTGAPGCVPAGGGGGGGCGANSVYKVDAAGPFCECTPGFVPVSNLPGDGCKLAPPGPVTCGANEILNASGNGCDCTSGYKRFSSGGPCESADLPPITCDAPNTAKYSPTDKAWYCTPPCDANSTFDAVSWKCICNKDFARDAAGNCSPVKQRVIPLPACPDGKPRNPDGSCSAPITPIKPTEEGTATSNPWPWIIAGVAVVGGGVLIYAASKTPKGKAVVAKHKARRALAKGTTRTTSSKTTIVRAR